MPDEGQPPNVLGAVESSSTFRAGWRRYEPDPLVIANRLDIAPVRSDKAPIVIIVC